MILAYSFCNFAVYNFLDRNPRKGEGWNYINRLKGVGVPNNVVFLVWSAGLLAFEMKNASLNFEDVRDLYMPCYVVAHTGKLLL